MKLLNITYIWCSIKPRETQIKPTKYVLVYACNFKFYMNLFSNSGNKTYRHITPLSRVNFMHFSLQNNENHSNLLKFNPTKQNILSQYSFHLLTSFMSPKSNLLQQNVHTIHVLLPL
jgi:hypothetical protein